MESLSHFQQILNTLSAFLFNCQTFLSPLIMADAMPDDISSKLSAPDLVELIEASSNQLKTISNILEPITRQLKLSTGQYAKSKMKPYAPFKIDQPPIVATSKEIYKQLSFEDIIANSDKPIEPIKRRVSLIYKNPCPGCGAPNDFIYPHTKVQFRCKVCKTTFNMKSRYHDEIAHYCPHCEHKLTTCHEHKGYNVLRCPNDRCPFFLDNKKAVKDGDGKKLLTHTNCHKLRYYFREFNFNLAQIKDLSHKGINSKVDLSKIHHSNYTLGLILTYYINYGLSSRKTAQILQEVHGLKISHQTVVNYAEAAAAIGETLNVKHPYELSDVITFDETYVKVNGKNHYVFFGSDTEKKIITSYRIFADRSSKEAVITLNETFNKFQSLPPDISVIADGNPIYNAAQVFFKLNDIEFNLHQVVGIKNKDEVSLKYRVFKQTEERLNRTFKQNYYGTNGYGSLRNANVYMSLYVSFFNFLRKHSSLNYRPPITIEEVEREPLMPNKWLRLLQHTLDSYRVSNVN